uniref:Putative secreted peptide n=1 Tax=Anopheles braziliensis TaxID=58242 RepID=A0A2M3ZQ37_9DIPT
MKRLAYCAESGLHRFVLLCDVSVLSAAVPPFSAHPLPNHHRPSHLPVCVFAPGSSSRVPHPAPSLLGTHGDEWMHPTSMLESPTGADARPRLVQYLGDLRSLPRLCQSVHRK